MSKRRRKQTDPMKIHRPDDWSRWIGQVLTELRRSNAAGKHGKSRKATRGKDKRNAIQDSQR